MQVQHQLILKIKNPIYEGIYNDLFEYTKCIWQKPGLSPIYIYYKGAPIELTSWSNLIFLSIWIIIFLSGTDFDWFFVVLLSNEL